MLPVSLPTRWAAGEALLEIRALGLAEALDLAFAVLRSNFRVFASIAVVAYVVPSALLYEVVDVAAASDPETLMGGVLFPLIVVLFSFMTGAVTIAVADEFLASGPSVARSIKRAFRYLRPLSVASFCYGIPIVILILLGTSAVVGGMAIAVAAQGVGAAVLGTIVVAVGVLLFALFVFVSAGLFLFSPIVVLEDLGALAALRRCWSLMRGYRLRMVGLMVLWVVSAAPGAGLELLLSEIPVVRSVLPACIEAAILSYLAIAEVVLYFDVRARSEAFDLEQLARAVELNTPG